MKKVKTTAAKTTTAKTSGKYVPVPMGVHTHTSRSNPSGQQIALNNNDGADYRPAPSSPTNTNNIPDSAVVTGAADDNY